jgi:tetratricopeptide (TPR) repeat protein
MEMAEGSTDAMRSPVAEALKEAYGHLRRADIRSAQAMLDGALKLDFDDPEVMFSLKCAGFWLDRDDRAKAIANPFERGEFVLGQWKAFEAYESRLEGRSDDARYAFRHFAFTSALECFRAVARDAAEEREADLSLRIGRCHKGRGEFEEAVSFFESSHKSRREDPEIIAELADAYALVNETRMAKALFREAFFLDPQRVGLDSLESFLIRALVSRVASMGFAGRELAEWIPVHAAILGVFNVKRELRPIESGKLRQSIYQLENEMREPDADRAVLVPRLLNRYFWLVDHMVAGREDRSKIDEVLLKIRILDPQIHRQYTA